ncbi:WD40/YVTN/BNR-like repeat-containing protein [Marinilactibacillus psychrotolerans]|uniref:WD40/YVTN/BNR-like repeat-containing protein n=1 Tax=Marinilactibacillus psychrotolerans TaxID=191770 RepID=UPI0038897B8B
MKTKHYLFRALVLNPFVILLYSIGCHYLISLAQYGGLRRNAPFIVGSFSVLLIWFILCLFLYFKHRKKPLLKGNAQRLKWITKTWFFIAIILLTFTTTYTGYKLYESAQPFQGRFSIYLDNFFNTKKAKFSHTNIYDSGIQGILDDIRSEVALPSELYVSNDFDLAFNKAGEIQSFSTALIGANEENEWEMYSIQYNNEEEISIKLEGPGYHEVDETTLLQPLIETVENIPLQESVAEFPDNANYSIYYQGYRSWGYNSEGIYWVNRNENVSAPDSYSDEEYAGYAVSVYVAGKEDTIPPKRFIDRSLTLSDNYIKKQEEEKNSFDLGYNMKDQVESYFLTEEIGFQLPITDASAGSRYYALEKTIDSGTSWERINQEPFYPSSGVSSGIIFFDEQLGFIGLSKNGGSEGLIYRTEDGGVTFEKIEIPKVEVTVNEDLIYNPFDLPDMPYLENETLHMTVGQGIDGDYNGGVKALYVSEDLGRTWTYVEEVKP